MRPSPISRPRSTTLPRIGRTVAVLTLFAITVAGPAAGFCPVNQANNGVDPYFWDAAGMPIPVYLVTGGATTWAGLNANAVGRAVGRTIDAINRNSLAAVRLRYAGKVNAKPNNAKGIYLFTTSDCNNTCGTGVIACTHYPETQANGAVENIDVFMTYNPASCPQHNWAFYPNTATGVDDLQATMTHELVHALGLAHSGNNGHCVDPGAIGVMAYGGSTTTEERHLSRDDAEGLISIYGRRFSELDYHYSYNGLSWSNGSFLNNQYTLGPLSSTSTATAGESAQWLAYTPWTWPPTFRTYVRSLTSTGATAVRPVGTQATYDAPAVAAGDGRIAVARFIGETPTNNSKRLQWAISNNAGTSWSFYNATRNNGNQIRTQRDGVTAAYDPRRERFIAAYVGDRNLSAPTVNTGQCADNGTYKCDEMRIATINTNGTDQVHTDIRPNGQTLRVAATPSIACADNGSAYNCVIAWVSNTGNACVHWGHARVNANGSFQLFNDLATGCYSGFSTPHVTWDASEPTKPWMLTLTQEGAGVNNQRIYTFRKANTVNSPWTDQRSFAVTTGFRIGGGIGGHGNGSVKNNIIYERLWD